MNIEKTRVVDPSPLLRLEGLAVLVLSLVLYAGSGGRWSLFAILLLAPDVSMLGYLRGNRTGAAVYNLLHTYVWPITLAVISLVSAASVLASLALIWSAHIGADRLLGFGLKYPSAFKVTHLQRL